MQTAINALQKLLDLAHKTEVLKQPDATDVFPIWGLLFGFMKLLVNKDISAASQDKHLQTAIAYLMLKVASIPSDKEMPADVPAASTSSAAASSTGNVQVPAGVQTAIAKIVRKHLTTSKVDSEPLVDVDALFKLVQWDPTHTSPTYARCDRTHEI